VCPLNTSFNKLRFINAAGYSIYSKPQPALMHGSVEGTCQNVCLKANSGRWSLLTSCESCTLVSLCLWLDVHNEKCNCFLIVWFEPNVWLLCHLLLIWTRFVFLFSFFILVHKSCTWMFTTYIDKTARGHCQHGRQVNWLALKGLWFRPKRLMFHNCYEIRRVMKTSAVKEFALEKKLFLSFFHSCVGSQADQDISLCHKRVSIRLLKFVYFSTALTPLVWFGVVSDIIKYCTTFLFLDF